MVYVLVEHASGVNERLERLSSRVEQVFCLISLTLSSLNLGAPYHRIRHVLHEVPQQGPLSSFLKGSLPFVNRTVSGPVIANEYSSNFNMVGCTMHLLKDANYKNRRG